MKGKMVSVALVTNKGKTIPTGLHDPKQPPEVDRRCGNCKWWTYLENTWKLNVCGNSESKEYARCTESDTRCKHWQKEEE